MQQQQHVGLAQVLLREVLRLEKPAAQALDERRQHPVRAVELRIVFRLEPVEISLFVRDDGLALQVGLDQSQRDQHRGDHRQQNGTEPEEHIRGQYRARHVFLFFFFLSLLQFFRVEFNDRQPDCRAKHHGGDRAVDDYRQQGHVPRDQRSQAIAPGPDADVVDVGFRRQDHAGQNREQLV